MEKELSAKRKPLLSAENSPKKQKSEDLSKAARREKLARLAANLRKNDRADLGEEVEDTSEASIGRLMKRKSGEKEQQQENLSPSKSAKKSSRWAKFAEERETWDNDFHEQNNLVEKNDRILVSPTKKAHYSAIQEKGSSSARDMVAEALSRRNGENKSVVTNQRFSGHTKTIQPNKKPGEKN